MNEKQYVSKSQLNSFTGVFGCPYAFYYSQVRKYKMKPTANFCKGACMEAVVKHYHATGKIDPTFFTTSLEQKKESDGYEMLSQEEKAEFDADIKEVYDKIPALMDSYKNQVKPMGNTITQLKLKHELTDYVITAYLDFVILPYAFEMKVTSRSWSDDKFRTNIDHRLYSALSRLELGYPLQYQYHVFVTTKTPQVQIMPVEVTEEEEKQAMNLMKNLAKQKASCIWEPLESDKTNCSLCGKDHSKEYFFN